MHRLRLLYYIVFITIVAALLGVNLQHLSAHQQLVQLADAPLADSQLTTLHAPVDIHAITAIVSGMGNFLVGILLTYLSYKGMQSVGLPRSVALLGVLLTLCGALHFFDGLDATRNDLALDTLVRTINILVVGTIIGVLPGVTSQITGIFEAARQSEERHERIQRINRAMESEIIERKRVEQELRSAVARERKVNALRANVITRMSHEFRTPLASARSASDLLLSYRNRMTDAQQDERLGQIQTAIDQMTALLEDILTMSEIDEQELKFVPMPTNLTDLCSLAIEKVRQTASTDHNIVFDCDGECEEVIIDRRLVEQIVSNLLLNAIKFSPIGGLIRLDVACSRREVSIQVRDEGIGIPAQDRPHIFDAFYRASNVGMIPGTGLGLAITRHAVEQHGGSITIDSVENRGTTVIIRLPIQK